MGQPNNETGMAGGGEKFLYVIANREVQDNGVYYAKDKRFLMEESVALAHEKAGVVKILPAPTMATREVTA